MKTKRQSNSPAGHAMEDGRAFYEIAEASADLASKDQGPTPMSLLRRLGTAYRLICERYRQRRQLLEMDDRQLKDIGITREEAELEARKPIWKTSRWLLSLHFSLLPSGRPAQKGSTKGSLIENPRPVQGRLR